VVSYIDSPVAGIIVREARVPGEMEHVAGVVSRVTRIASLLLQAVETSLFYDANMDSEEQNNAASGTTDRNHTDLSGASEVQAMLLKEAEKLGIDLSNADHPLQELMKIASQSANADSENSTMNTSHQGGNVHRKKDFDPLENLKTGSALDLSKIPLTEGEVKLVTLVLTGRLEVEDLGPFIYLALNSPDMDLVAATEEFYSLSEQQVQLHAQQAAAASIPQAIQIIPPSLSIINLSYTDIGDVGMDALSEFIFCDNAQLKTLDLSFCGISSQGLLSLCRGLTIRASRGLPAIQALVLAGNLIRSDVAGQLGKAIGCENSSRQDKRGRDGSRVSRGADEDAVATTPSRSYSAGIKLLHLGSTSLTPGSLVELLSGLGPTCPLQELKIQSNKIGSKGASVLFNFLETKSSSGMAVLPQLNRLDMSFNDLKDSGIAKLTRAISKRSKVNMSEVSISGNSIGSKGIESIMNKLLQHRLVTLNLDNNSIGDQGCQLVAASLPSISTLSRLNMSFNDIGCRGISTLMRSLVGCESITSLGLSGNVVRIAGAIAMGFALAQHPRLSVLELDNCCLSQVAQCHIVAGIISNRWVPMKVVHGFRAGPPMVAIGALEVMAQHLPNEECFRLRRDIQMKTMLQWMENNRTTNLTDPNLLTTDILSRANDATGAPSQSAYLRMLDWLGRIPFDSDELMDLRKYFYDIGGGEDGQKSQINLKHRGDIFAALAGDVAEKILEEDPIVFSYSDSSVGLDLNKSVCDSSKSEKSSFVNSSFINLDALEEDVGENGAMSGMKIRAKESDCSMTGRRNSLSSLSMSMGRSESHHSVAVENSKSSDIQYNARITMFPQFANKLENLKAVAQEMMDNEPDLLQQDVIAQQFAEASLTILRQLRYHCMENGLDGWRQGKLRRKVLIVDDSVVTRKLVARAFEKVNFIVDTAENGVEGVNKMKESIYDIAFMDIDMPVMNGFDATKALRMWEDAVRPGARQPICALTAAHVDDFDRTELMKFRDAGLNVMESKPCNIPRLFKVVDDVSPMFSDLSISASHYLDQNQINHNADQQFI
jgi:CheY-like chemotaxis protein